MLISDFKPTYAYKPIFISYAHDDFWLLSLVQFGLSSAGVKNYWTDWKIQGGTRWNDVIMGQIRDCSAFIILMTPNSVSSQYCRQEWQYALQLGKQVVPVLLKDCAIPPELSAIQYVDSRWDVTMLSEDSSFQVDRDLQIEGIGDKIYAAIKHLIPASDRKSAEEARYKRMYGKSDRRRRVRGMLVSVLLIIVIVVMAYIGIM